MGQQGVSTERNFLCTWQKQLDALERSIHPKLVRVVGSNMHLTHAPARLVPQGQGSQADIGSTPQPPPQAQKIEDPTQPHPPKKKTPRNEAK